MLGGGFPKKGCLTSTLGILHDSAAKTEMRALGERPKEPEDSRTPMRHRNNQANGLSRSLLLFGRLLFW